MNRQVSHDDSHRSLITTSLLIFLFVLSVTSMERETEIVLAELVRQNALMHMRGHTVDCELEPNGVKAASLGQTHFLLFSSFC